MRRRLAWSAVLIATACAVQNNPDPSEDTPADDGGSSSGGSAGKSSGGSLSSSGSSSGGKTASGGTSAGGQTSNGGKGGSLDEMGGDSSGGTSSGGKGGTSSGGTASGGKGGSGGTSSGGKGGTNSGGTAGSGGKGGSGGGGGTGGGGSNCTPSNNGPIGGLSARYQAEIMGNGTGIGSQLELYNAGPSTLNLADLKVRYYLTNEVSANINTGINWAWYRPTAGGGQDDKKPKVSFSIVPMDCKAATADAYIEFKFTADAGLLEAAHLLIFSWTANNANNQNFTQSNDYSFDGAAKIDADNSKIVILQNSGTRVWGTEP